MSFGDGNGTSYNPFVSLDITAHEMTHGITARTANLTYSGESGGLNEATSDIFGTAVEYYAANTADAGDFLIGEKIKRTGTPLYFRSMIKPSVDGYSADCWYSTVGSLLVHQSSGVANHFFYLLSQGTTAGNPSKTCLSSNTRVATGNGTLTGITRAKAEKIWYRALTVYMTSSTNYAAARVATIAPQDCPCNKVLCGLATWSTKMRRTRSVSSAAVVTANPPCLNTDPAQAWPSVKVIAQRLMSSSARRPWARLRRDRHARAPPAHRSTGQSWPANNARPQNPAPASTGGPQEHPRDRPAGLAALLWAHWRIPSTTASPRWTGPSPVRRSANEKRQGGTTC
jgi:hypothetical protein